MVTANAERPRFVALDSWRGIAALAVAFRHINGTAPFLNGQFHGNLRLAVDFFFVLSGFVIAMSYGERLAQGFSFLRFMVLRWGRVWPLHADEMQIKLDQGLDRLADLLDEAGIIEIVDPNRPSVAPARRRRGFFGR